MRCHTDFGRDSRYNKAGYPTFGILLPYLHQQNVKTSPGPPRGDMVPLVLLVHPDPPWYIFSVKFQKVWIRMDRTRPGGPQGPQPPLVDQERSGPPWTTLRHFPNSLWCPSYSTLRPNYPTFVGKTIPAYDRITTGMPGIRYYWCHW